MENLENGDLIVEDYIDSKNNDTLKSILMLKWATNNCKGAKFLMKTVDDAFINVANLANYIGNPSALRPKLLVGKLTANESVVRDSNLER
jgi:beta-1,3-galactosyltransferase 1